MTNFVISVLPYKPDLILALQCKVTMENMGLKPIGLSIEGADKGALPTHMVEDLLDLKDVPPQEETQKVYPRLTKNTLKALTVFV